MVIAVCSELALARLTLWGVSFLPLLGAAIAVAVVWGLAKAMQADGGVGLRVNHNLDVRVEGFDVHR